MTALWVISVIVMGVCVDFAKAVRGCLWLFEAISVVVVFGALLVVFAVGLLGMLGVIA